MMHRCFGHICRFLFFFLESLQTKAAEDAQGRKCRVLTLHVRATKVLPFSPRLGVKRWEEPVVTAVDAEHANVVELGCASLTDVQTAGDILE